MQKILILISLLLYGVGCGTTGQKNSRTEIKTYSDETVITAKHTLEHISVMEISVLSLEGVALDIVVDEDRGFAYIASGDAGLQIVDIHDPYNPKFAGLYDTPQYVNRVDIVNGVAYVSYQAQDWSEYVSVAAFDISNPYEAKSLGYYEGSMNNNHKLYSKDGLVYFVDQDGFKIVNEEDYSLIGRYDLFDTAYALSIVKNFVFVANGRNGLTILKAGEESYRATLSE
jgi:hypothetical protein